MLKNNIRHLPVMEKGQSGKPLGVISMREIIRALQQEDLRRENVRFSGDTLAQVQEQAKSQANILALESGSEGTKQDYLRAGFVVMAAGIGAALLQA
jgi:signal-transduction protein with cAMP-binding, CBS, and nucleotidyltransferase domain